MPKSVIDLHCHSTASDGDLSPTEVVLRAHQKGIKVLSLTDHDTLRGLCEARVQAESVGMQFVSGIEFSCVWNNFTVHVLGLNVDEGTDVMREAEAHQQDARIQRAQLINEKLSKKGLPETLELAESYAAGGPPGRPHFAKALIELEAVNDFAEAFKKYLGAGKPGDVKVLWPSIGTVIEWISSAQGKAVIAHPRKYNMTLTKLRSLIESFKLLGGDGIEVLVSGQKQGEAGLLADLCLRYGMDASLGSDFHSPKFPWADFGALPKLPSLVNPIWSDWPLAPILNGCAK